MLFQQIFAIPVNNSWIPTIYVFNCKKERTSKVLYMYFLLMKLSKSELDHPLLTSSIWNFLFCVLGTNVLKKFIWKWSHLCARPRPLLLALVPVITTPISFNISDKIKFHQKRRYLWDFFLLRKFLPLQQRLSLILFLTTKKKFTTTLKLKIGSRKHKIIFCATDRICTKDLIIYKME